MVMFGSIYFIMPRVMNWEWPYPRLISLHFWLVVTGFAIYIIWLSIGGWLQGLLGRKRGKVHRSGARLTYKDRLEARGRLADGTGYQLIKKVPVTLFDCMAATGVYNRYRRLKDR